MILLEYLPYLSAILVGFVMGLLGGGGSILTIPIFVYLFGFTPVLATAYSLFVTGAAATVGTFKNFQQHNINIRVGLLFGIPSFIGTYITRRYILPNMPEHLFTIFGIDVTKDIFIMLVFSVMMILASTSMINGKSNEEKNGSHVNTAFTIIIGLIIGLFTGFVGAGGGFIIVPALIFLTGLPVKKAIGTSLFIIMMKSFIGFIGDLQTTAMDWNFLLIFSILSSLGILIGIAVAKKTDPSKLKSIFGWLILIIGLAVITKEIYSLVQ